MKASHSSSSMSGSRVGAGFPSSIPSSSAVSSSKSWARENTISGCAMSAATMFDSGKYRFTRPLPPVVGLPDGTDRVCASEQRPSSHHPKDLWRAMVRQLARLEDNAFGDALGVLFLFASLWSLLWLAPIVEGIIK